MEKPKRILKNPIKFKISLNEEQKRGKETILANKVTILKGKAGSGKSLLAAQAALDLLFTNAVSKIIITRPTVTAEEDLGFLPGSFEDKLAPYTAGTFGHIVDLTDTVKLEAMIKEGRIEVEPLGFMRGRNFSDCVVILEEAQNCKRKQMKLLLTRLCKGSKLIMTGDEDQVDLKPESLSCYGVLARLLPTLDDVAVVELLENHRDELVDRILELYKGHPELQ